MALQKKSKAQNPSLNIIAEVLIDKLNELERTQKSLENTTQKIHKINQEGLQLDLEELKKVNQKRKEEEDAFLSNLRAFKKINKGRAQNWIIALLCAVFLTSIGLSLYAWKKAEQYDQQKTNAEYFEQKYIETQQEGN